MKKFTDTTTSRRMNCLLFIQKLNIVFSCILKDKFSLKFFPSAYFVTLKNEKKTKKELSSLTQFF